VLVRHQLTIYNKGDNISTNRKEQDVSHLTHFNMIATAAFGIESVVGQELKELGFEDVVVENGRVLFKADAEGVCKANLWLRSAERVFINVASFRAFSFVELFDKIEAIPWEDYIPADGRFPVNAKSIKSKLFSLSDIQSISKKAMVKRLGKVYNIEWFEETGPEFPIHVAFLKDEVTVSIDTSGVGLHKRGYRESGSEAPLKETLAAALVKISRWKSFIPLVDPMCGSGTILIEAAMMARNIAPGLNRKFISETWDFIPKEAWKKVRQEAYQAIDLDTPLHIQGFDINQRAVKIAMQNAEKAGLEDDIHFQVRDAKDLSSSKQYGYIITNPPYGERLSDEYAVEDIYKMMGKSYGTLDTWSAYILTSHENFERCYGKKSTKNRKLYNGKIKTYFYQYFGPRPPRRKTTEE